MYNKSPYVQAYISFYCKIVFVRLCEIIAYPNHSRSQLVQIIVVLLKVKSAQPADLTFFNVCIIDGGPAIAIT